MTTDDKLDRLAAFICDAMEHVTQEPIILARSEEFMDPKPASILDSVSENDLNQRIDVAIEKMGGSPKFWVQVNDKPPPIADTYPDAAFQEAITTFWRARKSICRSHMIWMANSLIEENPGWIFPDGAEEYSKAVTRASAASFWEQAEDSYIRLASFWDRVGQILDFRFFRIRQFERDGFTAVMDRIHSNIKPISHELTNSDSWERIRKFQTSEKDDGAKWLLRRRNIVVHSLHLRAADTLLDEVSYKPMYNHLEENLKSRLAPRTPEEEVKQLHLQLACAAKYFNDVIEVICTSEDRPTPPF
jgi:hypothetical protein